MKRILTKEKTNKAVPTSGCGKSWDIVQLQVEKKEERNLRRQRVCNFTFLWGREGIVLA